MTEIPSIRDAGNEQTSAVFDAAEFKLHTTQMITKVTTFILIHTSFNGLLSCSLIHAIKNFRFNTSLDGWNICV